MAGFFQSLAAFSAHSLLAQVDGPASVNSLPISPIKVMFLLGWVYACLYSG